MGGDWPNRTQCLNPGSNEWLPTQTAFNGGLNDQWPAASAPQAYGYYKREDIAFHYALADAFTIADQYHVSTRYPSQLLSLCHADFGALCRLVFNQTQTRALANFLICVAIICVLVLFLRSLF